MKETNPKIPQETDVSDDSLKIKVTSHPFRFEKSPDKALNELIVEAINSMGATGENAEKTYQKSLEKLRPNAEKVLSIIVSEYASLPEMQYLNRWSLIQLLAELKHPSSLKPLDEILITPIPPERSKDPRVFSTRKEEVIIRTTAIEAVTRIAAEDNKEATDILLKHSRHENFSIKRAAIQGYLKVGGEIAKKRLLETMPKKDRYIANIQQTDVRLVPQPPVEEFAKPPEIDDSPKKSRPRLREQKPSASDNPSDSDEGGSY